MRIIKDPEERRNEILDVAEELLSTKGYDKMTVNDILKEVKIAKGTFYHYFRSKEAVMEAVVDRIINNGVKIAKSIAADKQLGVPEKIFQILIAQGPDMNKQQIIDELHQVNNEKMHQKSLVETIIHLTPILTDVIEQGIDEGIFKTPYPKETIEILLVASQFIFDEGIFNWPPEELAKKAVAFVHIVETTLGAKKGTFSFILEIINKH